MTGVVVASTPRLQLVALTPAALTVVRSGVRALLGDGERWAPDYPTDGDVLLAGLALGPGPLATAQAPWGLLQVRLLDGAGPAVAVGGIGFKTPPADGEAEIGYGMAPSAQGRGVATEAVLAVLGLARRHGMSAVTAQTATDNVASRRVLEKNGFAAAGADGDLLQWRREV